MRTMLVGIATALLLAGSAQVVLSQAPNYQSQEYMDLAKALPNAKHTLAEAVMTVTKGTEVPTAVEIAENPRAASARLRAAERIRARRAA